jgi:hypothetical protein
MTPAEAGSSGSGVAGGSIARTADAEVAVGACAVCNARTLARPGLITAIAATNNIQLSVFTARIIASGIDGSVTITVHI